MKKKKKKKVQLLEGCSPEHAKKGESFLTITHTLGSH